MIIAFVMAWVSWGVVWFGSFLLGFLSSKLEEQRFAKLLVIGCVSSRVMNRLYCL